ncbi:uncharacterized protein MYCFIDRAFT_209564 [Pseudocercospora fijiensis CIRAD86]|uniref:Uncharacterized protein n=1 Tax=Pseudocercospora fijiensis (strain CIRAD86) TaxID=383855 RepID=N1Q7K7_PSEFD|nr:uncharacterized protein MYCFIDRAFT_209564 [Pseudocercospora fijiensis CIRAD86]EME87631.1 hypothetical protein MYCFIDRAFT_209564 [Pseudocercospora fijiensis CIRAD86]
MTDVIQIGRIPTRRQFLDCIRTSSYIYGIWRAWGDGMASIITCIDGVFQWELDKAVSSGGIEATREREIKHNKNIKKQLHRLHISSL